MSPPTNVGGSIPVFPADVTTDGLYIGSRRTWRNNARYWRVRRIAAWRFVTAPTWQRPPPKALPRRANRRTYWPAVSWCPTYRHALQLGRLALEPGPWARKSHRHGHTRKPTPETSRSALTVNAKTRSDIRPKIAKSVARTPVTRSQQQPFIGADRWFRQRRFQCLILLGRRAADHKPADITVEC
jgi:hypothetical protein